MHIRMRCRDGAMQAYSFPHIICIHTQKQALVQNGFYSLYYTGAYRTRPKYTSVKLDKKSRLKNEIFWKINSRNEKIGYVYPPSTQEFIWFWSNTRIYLSNIPCATEVSHKNRLCTFIFLANLTSEKSDPQMFDCRALSRQFIFQILKWLMDQRLRTGKNWSKFIAQRLFHKTHTRVEEMGN